MNRAEAPSRFGLIIGAMKSGTTTLFTYLADHPAVAAARVKEPDFFTDPGRPGAGSPTPPHGADALAAYRALWDWDASRHQVAVEASTSYTMQPLHEGVPERVKSLGDLEFRFMYLMRDPVARTASHLTHLATRRGGPERVGEADFETAVQVSRYASQLDAWTAYWPREAFLPLVYEELVSRPAGLVERVQAFLGLDPRPVDPALVGAHNARTEMAADQALAGLLAQAPWLEAVRPWVPGPLVRAVRWVAGRTGSHAVVLSAEQRERAVERLRPEARRVGEEWGVDTSFWESVR